MSFKECVITIPGFSAYVDFSRWIAFKN